MLTILATLYLRDSSFQERDPEHFAIEVEEVNGRMTIRETRQLLAEELQRLEIDVSLICTEVEVRLELRHVLARPQTMHASGNLEEARLGRTSVQATRNPPSLLGHCLVTAQT